ncbi:hypothetical protein [Dactylosporangium sp. NPDC051541]|uniref:hypothetical protein n=1 Tax=Dactylosporangium sp. NPDC051541 TaxID=3363977 RepID=UPI00378F8B40
MIGALATAGCGANPAPPGPAAASSQRPPAPPSASPSPSRQGIAVPSVAPITPQKQQNIYGDLPVYERQVLWKLEDRTLRQAGANGSLLGSCDQRIDGSAAVTTTCTITFDGLAVPFSVTAGAGGAYAQWRATQTSGPLIRTAVHAAWYRYVSANAPGATGTAMCDARMPERSLVNFSSPFYECWYTADGATVVRSVRLTEAAGVTFA